MVKVNNDSAYFKAGEKIGQLVMIYIAIQLIIKGVTIILKSLESYP